MQILLDECIPKPLKRELLNYEIRTVVEMGWSGKKNGELLQLMQLIALRYTELKDSVSVEACFSINSLFFSKTLENNLTAILDFFHYYNQILSS